MPLHNQQPPPSTAPVAHHVRPHPQQPRHVNPSSVAHSAAELLSNVSAATVGQQQQQQQPMVVVAGGGAVTGGSGGGVFGRNGLPVVVPGPPPHPHGPLIRGNFVPRLLAPLQAGGGFSSGGAGGSLPLYAIVKPQSQQPHQQQQRPIVGGPPVHVCIGGGAPHCPPAKLGPATAPGNTTPCLSLLCSGRKECRVACFFSYPPAWLLSLLLLLPSFLLQGVICALCCWRLCFV